MNVMGFVFLFIIGWLWADYTTMRNFKLGLALGSIALALTAVFLTLEQAIAFDAIDNQPVDILFALLVPESECKTHLKTLSLIASKLNDKAFCRQLRQAEDDEALYQLMIAP